MSGVYLLALTISSASISARLMLQKASDSSDKQVHRPGCATTFQQLVPSTQPLARISSRKQSISSTLSKYSHFDYATRFCCMHSFYTLFTVQRPSNFAVFITKSTYRQFLYQAKSTSNCAEFYHFMLSQKGCYFNLYHRLTVWKSSPAQ